MKLDYDLIKEILEEVEENDGFTRRNFGWNDFEDNDEGKQKFINLAYHYKIAIGAGLIEGKVLEAETFGGGNPLVGFSYKGLTLAGVQTLEAMRNDTLWNQIKDSAIEMGTGGLRAIPALALAAFMG